MLENEQHNQRHCEVCDDKFDAVEEQCPVPNFFSRDDYLECCYSRLCDDGRNSGAEILVFWNENQIEREIDDCSQTYRIQREFFLFERNEALDSDEVAD